MENCKSVVIADNSEEFCAGLTAALSRTEGFQVIGTSDYQASKRVDGDVESVIDLPKSNVLEFRLEDDNKLIVRPSGTEPKIKIYLSGKGKTREDGEAIIAKMAELAPGLLEI